MPRPPEFTQEEWDSLVRCSVQMAVMLAHDNLVDNFAQSIRQGEYWMPFLRGWLKDIFYESPEYQDAYFALKPALRKAYHYGVLKTVTKLQPSCYTGQYIGKGKPLAPSKLLELHLPPYERTAARVLEKMNSFASSSYVHDSLDYAADADYLDAVYFDDESAIEGLNTACGGGGYNDPEMRALLEDPDRREEVWTQLKRDAHRLRAKEWAEGYKEIEEL